MAKLTDIQLVVLSKAAARDDGCAIAPPKLNKAAASKVGSSLVARKLLREVRSKAGMPVWREDADNRLFSLIITSVGKKVIGANKTSRAGRSNQIAASKKKDTKPAGGSTAPSKMPRAGSKHALVVDLLSADGGTTIDAIVDATGWLPNTTRAALTGLRKKGFAISWQRQPGRVSVYRISGGAAA